MIGFTGQADPHFFAVQDVFVADAPRTRLDVSNVTPGAWFREAKCGDLLPTRLGCQESLFLFLGAPLQQSQAIQPNMNRHDDPQGRIDSFQFFACQAECYVIESLASVPYGNTDT